jgi:uncharacterized protein
MSEHGQFLIASPERFAVCRLDAAAAVPDWSMGGSFWCVTRTHGELAVVCEAARVPPGIQVEAPWRLLELEGPIPFTTIGVIASLATPLAAAGVSIFVLSTFDTDYLLLREAVSERGFAALRAAGHELRGV